MRRKKIAALFMVLTILILSGAVAFAEDYITINGSGVAEINSSDLLPTENQEPAATTEPAAEVTPTPTTDPNAAAGTETGEIQADQDAPTIVKHPGSEYDKAAGDSVLFTAACSQNVDANWFFNEGIPIAQIGSVYPGVSATVADTIYNSTYPGTKVTISNLTRASSGMKVYVEFSTDYGILKSNEATITVTRGTDKPLTATPSPTVVPTATPAVTPVPTPVITPVPTPVQAVTPDAGALNIATPDTAQTATVATVAPAPATGTVVDVSGLATSTTPNEGSGYRFTSTQMQKWEAPGATLAVAACAIVAVIAILLMLLYSMGAIRLRFLERLVAGKDYVSPDDDDYEE